MSIRVRAKFYIDWVGDGIGAMEAPGAQSLVILTQFAGSAAPTQAAPIEAGTIAPGGNTPSQANMQTALNACATDIGNQIAANNSALLTRIQNFATGTP